MASPTAAAASVAAPPPPYPSTSTAEEEEAKSEEAEEAKEESVEGGEEAPNTAPSGISLACLETPREGSAAIFVDCDDDDGNGGLVVCFGGDNTCVWNPLATVESLPAERILEGRRAEASSSSTMFFPDMTCPRVGFGATKVRMTTRSFRRIEKALEHLLDNDNDNDNENDGDKRNHVDTADDDDDDDDDDETMMKITTVIVAAGGWDVKRKPLNTVELLPFHQTPMSSPSHACFWRSHLPDLEHQRGDCAVASFEGLEHAIVLAVGGRASSGCRKSVEYWRLPLGEDEHQELLSWKSLPSRMHHPRCRCSAVVVSSVCNEDENHDEDNKKEDKKKDNEEKFPPRMDDTRGEQEQQQEEPKSGADTVLEMKNDGWRMPHDDRHWLVVIGGEVKAGRPTASVEAFDFSTGAWQELPSLSHPRAGCAAVVIGSRVFVVGGYGNCDDGDNDIALRTTVEYLDVAHLKQGWRTVETPRTIQLSMGRANCAAVVVKDRQENGAAIVVLGGSDEHGQPLNTVDVLRLPLSLSSSWCSEEHEAAIDSRRFFRQVLCALKRWHKQREASDNHDQDKQNDVLRQQCRIFLQSVLPLIRNPLCFALAYSMFGFHHDVDRWRHQMARFLHQRWKDATMAAGYAIHAQALFRDGLTGPGEEEEETRGDPNGVVAKSQQEQVADAMDSVDGTYNRQDEKLDTDNGDDDDYYDDEDSPKNDDGEEQEVEDEENEEDDKTCVGAMMRGVLRNPHVAAGMENLATWLPDPMDAMEKLVEADNRNNNDNGERQEQRGDPWELFLCFLSCLVQVLRLAPGGHDDDDDVHPSNDETLWTMSHVTDFGNVLHFCQLRDLSQNAAVIDAIEVGLEMVHCRHKERLKVALRRPDSTITVLAAIAALVSRQRFGPQFSLFDDPHAHDQAENEAIQQGREAMREVLFPNGWAEPEKDGDDDDGAGAGAGDNNDDDDGDNKDDQDQDQNQDHNDVDQDETSLPPVAEVPFAYIRKCCVEEVLLGQGHFGTVYLGQDPKLGKQFAIKQMKNVDTLIHTEEKLTQVRKTFLRDLKTLRAANNPYIAKLYAYHMSPGPTGEICLVFEYAQRGSLANVLRKSPAKKRLSPQRRISIAHGVSQGLLYLHQELKRYHRDIKSANIVLTLDYTPKIIDCGLSKSIPDAGGGVASYSSLSSGSTGTLGAVGTRQYQCPVYHAGGIPFESQCDVYSFGIVLYELFCGHLQCDPTDVVHTYAMDPSNLPQADESGGAWELSSAEKLSVLASRCCQYAIRDRCTLEEAVSELQGIDVGDARPSPHSALIDAAVKMRHVIDNQLSLSQHELMVALKLVLDQLELMRTEQCGIKDMIQGMAADLSSSVEFLARLITGEKSRCPALVVVMDDEKKSLGRRLHPKKRFKDLFTKKVKMHFLCEHSYESVSHGIPLRESKDWFKKVAPAIKLSLDILKAANLAIKVYSGLGIPGADSTMLESLDAALLDVVDKDAKGNFLDTQQQEEIMRSIRLEASTAQFTGKVAILRNAYRAVAEKAWEKANGKWRNELTPVRKRGDNSILWVKNKYKDLPQYENVTVQRSEERDSGT